MDVADALIMRCGVIAMAEPESLRVHSLRTALEAAESVNHLVRVRHEVDAGYEIPNVLRMNTLQPQRPALLFEQIRGLRGWRVAAALLADPSRACRLFNLPIDRRERQRRVLELLAHPIPPVAVAVGPCQENVISRDIDLPQFLPWTHGALHVSHRYLQGPVITRDMETGAQNLAIYRTCIQGPTTMTVNGRWDRHLGLQLSEAKRRGQAMPVAIVLGPDPLLFSVACSKLPYGADDLGLVGAIRDRPVDLVRCKTVDLLVPADAEVVIEGEFRPPYELGDDGPWPEYLGYLGMEIHPPVMHVTCVTHRNDPISYVTIPGASGDNHGMLSEPLLLHHLRSFMPYFVTDCALVPGTRMHHAAIQVRKSDAHHEGLQLNVALAAFGNEVELDRVTLVDDDVDVSDPTQLAWAEATRCNPRDQMHVLCDARSHQNNPIAGVRELFGEPILRSKVIVDATIPWKYRTAEKAPGVTFFTRSSWQAVNLAHYFTPQDAQQWVRREAEGVLTS